MSETGFESGRGASRARSLRLARADDAAGIAAVYAPSVTGTVISFEMTPPTADEMRQRLAKVQPALPWLVCEANDQVVGYAYASRHHERAAYQWSLDCAVYIGSEQRRTGVGRALYTTLFQLIELQGYYAVHAGITLPNAASVGLHEAFGFRPVAVYPKVGYKFGAWHDVGWWQLELQERRSEPSPPRSAVAVAAQQPEAWALAFAAGQRLLG
jgi:L-amino acid N-acyltransferase YncA